MPPDREMEAHDREAHGGDGDGNGNGKDGDGFELDYTEKREMEGLEDALAGLGGKAQEVGLREEALLQDLERRFNEILQRALLP